LLGLSKHIFHRNHFIQKFWAASTWPLDQQVQLDLQDFNFSVEYRIRKTFRTSSIKAIARSGFSRREIVEMSVINQAFAFSASSAANHFVRMPSASSASVCRSLGSCFRRQARAKPSSSWANPSSRSFAFSAAFGLSRLREGFIAFDSLACLSPSSRFKFVFRSTRFEAHHAERELVSVDKDDSGETRFTPILCLPLLVLLDQFRSKLTG
jgi:hypothetical protein